MSAYYSRARSYSRSYNAHLAEEDGRMPLTRAVAYVAEHAVTTQVIARAVLLRRGTDEWHHVGKYATPVYYYDAVSAVDWAWAITPAATRRQVLRRWTRLAFSEARDRRYREQLAVRERPREQIEEEARAFSLRHERAALRDLERAYRIETLIAAYRRNPTPGRAQALRQYQLDPATILSTADAVDTARAATAKAEGRQ